ncbi:protein PF3D7_1417600-like [Mytilus edulis]|uniref:protein PF3D7_1417600-like n=3 Tax=Mytilus TaxID=6548 RepID=UPI0039F0A068
MGDMEKSVLEMLVPIFPNLTQEILQASVQHPSNHGDPLTSDTLLQRCIDDLLELRTFTEKTLVASPYRQPTEIDSDDSTDSERDTSKDKTVNDIRLAKSNIISPSNISLSDATITGHNNDNDVQITGHTPSKDCLIVSEKTGRKQGKKDKPILKDNKFKAACTSVKDLSGAEKRTLALETKKVKSTSDDMYREIEFSSDSNSSDLIHQIFDQTDSEDDLPMLNSPIKNSPLKPSQFHGKLDKVMSSPDFSNWRDKANKSSSPSSVVASDKTLIQGRNDLLVRSNTVPNILTTTPSSVIGTKNSLLTTPSVSPSRGVTATVNVSHASDMNVNITVNVSAQSLGRKNTTQKQQVKPSAQSVSNNNITQKQHVKPSAQSAINIINNITQNQQLKSQSVSQKPATHIPQAGPSRQEKTIGLDILPPGLGAGHMIQQTPLGNLPQLMTSANVPVPMTNQTLAVSYPNPSNPLNMRIGNQSTITANSSNISMNRPQLNSNVSNNVLNTADSQSNKGLLPKPSFNPSFNPNTRIQRPPSTVHQMPYMNRPPFNPLLNQNAGVPMPPSTIHQMTNMNRPHFNQMFNPTAGVQRPPSNVHQMTNMNRPPFNPLLMGVQRPSSTITGPQTAGLATVTSTTQNIPGQTTVNLKRPAGSQFPTMNNPTRHVAGQVPTMDIPFRPAVSQRPAAVNPNRPVPSQVPNGGFLIRPGNASANLNRPAVALSEPNAVQPQHVPPVNSVKQPDLVPGHTNNGHQFVVPVLAKPNLVPSNNQPTNKSVAVNKEEIQDPAIVQNQNPPVVIPDEESTPERKKAEAKEKLRQEMTNMFPDIDPTYVDQLYDRLQDHNWQMIINNACMLILENPQYPKKSENKPQPQVPKTLPKIDYYKEYSGHVTGPYRNQCEMLLQSEFKWISLKDIRNIMKCFNGHYAPSHKVMTAIMNNRAQEFTKMKESNPLMHPYSQAKAEIKVDGVYGERIISMQFLKCGRPLRSEVPVCPELVHEKEFIRIKTEEETKEQDHIMAVSVNEHEYEESGQLIECGCCYGEVAFEMMIQCYEGHLFCQECLERYAKESVFGHGKADLLCMTDGCDASYPMSQLQKALSSNILSKYEDRVQEENINLADLTDLVRCPSCDFAALMDPEDKVFKCHNHTCLKETCRYCKEDWTEHFGKRCEEIEKKDEVKLRLQFEEKMTEAKIRTCHKCKAKFTKSDGCNKMTCRCGAKMCYICRKPNIDYDHFCRHFRDPNKGKNCTECTSCSLWSNPEQDDERAVSEIRKEAEEVRKTMGYNDDKLIGAPDEPPSKKPRIVPPGNPRAQVV